MKKFICLLLILCSCKTDKSVILPLQNTYKINSSDSKKEIIVKASHVVPTKNQFEALKNEFIAFVHFGPNTFTKMEWGNGMEDPKIFNLKRIINSTCF